jgi:capsular polysaccharide biosynthesis protein
MFKGYFLEISPAFVATVIEKLIKNNKNDTANIITNYLNDNIQGDNDYKIRIIKSLDISEHEKEELILKYI